jgi:hypothetical protein
MPVITYERTSRKSIKVIKDGAFAGWMDQSYFNPTGFQKGYTYWTVRIDGQDLSAATVTALKAKISKLIATEA